MHTYVNRTRTVEDKMSQREIIALLKETMPCWQRYYKKNVVLVRNKSGGKSLNDGVLFTGISTVF